MKREVMTTGDGSKTIHMPDLNEQYHSKHGALQEALHVFIETGLRHVLSKVSSQWTALNIMEFGYGTGLNAMLTAQQNFRCNIQYTGIEAFPISDEEVTLMDYGSLLNDVALNHQLHNAAWEKWQQVTKNFEIFKTVSKFEEVHGFQNQDLIYYDAFGPRTQPELWTVELFGICFNCLKPGGVLVTYCAQGQARRNMIEAGFNVERLPGPPGKREMLRATKPI